MLSIDNKTLVRLSDEYSILPFNCGDEDLNDFLFSDAKPALKSLLATTYLIEFEGGTSAFYSLSNDKISYEDCDSNRGFKKLFQQRFAPSKKFKSYPAVKIGRFAIDLSMQRNGLGTQLLDYIKGSFVNNNKTGCMYITVDAYRKSLNFYLRNDFVFLNSKDEGSETRLMYYDLGQLL